MQTHDNRGYVGNFVLFHEIAAALKLADVYGYSFKIIDKVLSLNGTAHEHL